MLQIQHLTITHKKDLRVILNDFSCVWNHGDKAVIIGEEGNGKSTLLKWIYRPDLLESYAEGSGERIVNNERLGYLPQELPCDDQQRTLYEFFSQEPLFWEQTPRQLGKLASDFGLNAEFFYGDQRMGTLSGGEKIKAQMMRLMIAAPTVLLLDEPSNDLDLETLTWLEQLITRTDKTVLYISHDEALIEKTATMVIHIEQLRRKQLCRCTVAHVPYSTYISRRKADFERQERLALNDLREKKIRDEKLHRVEQSVSYKLGHLSKAERDAPGRLLKKKMKAVKSMEKRFEREDENMARFPEEESAIFFRLGSPNSLIPAGKTVLALSLDELRTPDGGRVLATDLSLRIRGPEKVCIIGPNGSGKTTFLRRIQQELSGRDDLRSIYMPQNYEDLLELDQTPVAYLSIRGDKEEQTRIRTFLGALKFTPDEMEHRIAELSGGQKAKILLLKMSMSDANVLILDEPTRNFSPLSGPVIRKMLSEFPGAIISISHDRKYIDEVSTAVYRLTEHGLTYLPKR